MYNDCHTAFDVMKEFLITGCELDGKYQIPMLPRFECFDMPEDSVDFETSFGNKIKNHRRLNVNFYIDDTKFMRFWNNPDRYMEHLCCFHSVTCPDFSISTGEKGMPFALNIFNKYRSHALAWYMHLNNIPVIPSVTIADKDSYDWCFDGLPENSVLSVCTNGRIRAKESRIEFCDGFKYMCDKLSPSRVIIVGKIPDELNENVPITNYMTRNQRINKDGV